MEICKSILCNLFLAGDKACIQVTMVVFEVT